MKYPQLKSLVPAGEHFDESAVNEGVYLTTAHIVAIEAALAGNAGIVSGLNTAVTEANTARDTAVAAQATAEGALATANTSLQAANTKVTTLEAKVEELEADPVITNTIKNLDAGAKGKVPFHASAENPMNKIADQFFGSPKAKEEEK